jgi:uncharacterized membrane-anchored protein YhcB (DUF1043 family)
MLRRLIGPIIGVVVGYLIARRTELLNPIRALRSRKVELEGLTKDQLYERAQKAEIPGRSDMTKEQLIKALRKRNSE